MDKKQWHYMKDEQSTGPFSEKEIISKIESSEISKNTLVWPEDGEDWRPAKDVFDLQDLFPPPLPGKKLINLGGIKENLLNNEWHTTPVHPWRRYFARILDVMVFGTMTFSIIGMVFYVMAPSTADDLFSSLEEPGGQIFDMILTTFVATFFSAAFIGFIGTSIGKWIFGIKVTDQSGKPIGFKKAWDRELKVWFRGLGMGIPLVVLFTTISAYQKLRKNGATSWDEEMGLKVSYKNNSFLQILMSVIGFIVLISITAMLRVM